MAPPATGAGWIGWTGPWIAGEVISDCTVLYPRAGLSVVATCESAVLMAAAPPIQWCARGTWNRLRLHWQLSTWRWRAPDKLVVGSVRFAIIVRSRPSQNHHASGGEDERAEMDMDG